MGGGGWEGGATTRGADGIGKMRGKREGETDILETGRASGGSVNELVCMGAARH